MTQRNYTAQLALFESYIRDEEKSHATMEKYMRDVRLFISFL